MKYLMATNLRDGQMLTNINMSLRSYANDDAIKTLH